MKIEASDSNVCPSTLHSSISVVSGRDRSELIPYAVLRTCVTRFDKSTRLLNPMHCDVPGRLLPEDSDLGIVVTPETVFVVGRLVRPAFAFFAFVEFFTIVKEL